MTPSRPREEKGLRHFAVRICHKVEEKGETTYNEVADELVAELLRGDRGVTLRDPASEEKNVRRRVYDALNVLCAIGVVRKDRRSVRWCGLPRASAREQSLLEDELSRLSSSVRDKDRCIQRYRRLARALERLAQRNARGSAASGRVRSPAGRGEGSLRLPFLLIATEPDAAVEIAGDEPGSGYCRFAFSRPFEVYDADGVLLALESSVSGAGVGDARTVANAAVDRRACVSTTEADPSLTSTGSVGDSGPGACCEAVCDPPRDEYHNGCHVEP
ncbi:hypothetical protein F1559_004428 [Cyanidiococcus yangmingshanensis]|uniref:E2F/DP family winged-helix DNA-binding domain-containing protein n=1 Tax=Cyanidiococcus yangmingshanensis TaxID=2690220 RepID=A0A7J7IKW7_9RHOD|nr:hypothetical protein F1559_004428 [Cyanidiococcus yangmingshanensis]